MNSIHTLVSILFWTQAPAHWRLLHITLDTFYLWWIQLGKLQNLRDGWAAANGIPYESRKSPYFRLIFTQHTIWPLRNPKKSTVRFRSPPPNDASDFVRPPLTTRPKIFAPPLTQKLKVPKTPKKHKNLVLGT